VDMETFESAGDHGQVFTGSEVCASVELQQRCGVSDISCGRCGKLQV
jgi:hypothetical protein